MAALSSRTVDERLGWLGHRILRTFTELRYWYRGGSPLHWSRYGVACAVFDPDTGETHFPSDLSSLVLEHIDQIPLSLSHLMDRLDAPADLPLESLQQIHQALLSLERAELVTSELIDSD